MKSLFALASYSLLFLVSCQLGKQSQPPSQISYSEFRKVLTPKSAILPLPGGEESVLLMMLPGDEYSKLYKLIHKTRKFKLLYDAGTNIAGIERDRGNKNYYIYLDDHGDENYQIFKLDLKTKERTKIFGKKERKTWIIDSSVDGTRLFLSSNIQNKAKFRIYEFNVITGKHKALSSGKISFYAGVADPKGRYLALTRPLSNNEQHLYLLNLKTKVIKKVLGSKATVYDASFFHPQKDELFVNTDWQQDRTGCAKISLASPSELKWVKLDPTKDIECHYSREVDTTLVYNTFDGQVKLQLYEGVFKSPIKINFPKRSIVSQFSPVPGSQDVIAQVGRSNSPGNYYKFDLKAPSSTRLEQVSKLNLSSIDTESFATSYDFHFNSFDGMKIHGIIFAKDDWIKSDEKRPVILWPHGGPDSHVKHRFHPFFQYWVQKGFVVFAPNFRGSTGYGKRFETLNDRDWGGGHIKDLIYGKNELKKLSYVDRKNIFIVGASFGGYSTLSAITQYPKEFKAAVAMVALANLFTFMESIPQDPAWQGEFRSELGDPILEKTLYKERSPYFYAKNIEIPVKIYQAENDTRTVKAEMDNFVSELKKYKIPVEYEILEKEGHRIARGENWEKILQGTVDFLERQMKKNKEY